MEKEIKNVFRNGNQDEVLSEAFRLTITRKDIQTLNHLNWLNDEVISGLLCMQIVCKTTWKLNQGVTVSAKVVLRGLCENSCGTEDLSAQPSHTVHTITTECFHSPVGFHCLRCLLHISCLTAWPPEGTLGF